MKPQRLPNDFVYLADMYGDSYYPKPLVDKVKNLIQETVRFIEEGGHTREEIQASFDQMTLKINDLQGEFDDQGSELETVARESIGATVVEILRHFEIDIAGEDAIRERDW